MYIWTYTGIHPYSYTIHILTHTHTHTWIHIHSHTSTLTHTHTHSCTHPNLNPNTHTYIHSTHNLNYIHIHIIQTHTERELEWNKTQYTYPFTKERNPCKEGRRSAMGLACRWRPRRMSMECRSAHGEDRAATEVHTELVGVGISAKRGGELGHGVEGCAGRWSRGRWDGGHVHVDLDKYARVLRFAGG